MPKFSTQRARASTSRAARASGSATPARRQATFTYKSFGTLALRRVFTNMAGRPAAPPVSRARRQSA